MTIERYEKIFLSLGGGLLIVCIIALFIGSFGEGMQLPGRVGTIDPQQIDSTPPFDQPGVRQLGPDSYEVVVVGEAWKFTPQELRVPANAEITFVSTSRDVLHGFSVEGTKVNMMLIPGQIARKTYRFKDPGEYLLICHEYCGGAHHTMYGRIIVE